MNRIESLKALRLPRRSRRTSLRPGASGGRQSAFPVLPGRKFETPTVTRPRVRRPIASQIIKSYCFNNKHHQRAHLGSQIGSPRSFALQSICSLATVVPFVPVTRHAFLTGLFWNSCRGSSNNTNGQLILPVPYAVILLLWRDPGSVGIGVGYYQLKDPAIHFLASIIFLTNYAKSSARIMSANIYSANRPNRGGGGGSRGSPPTP